MKDFFKGKCISFNSYFFQPERNTKCKIHEQLIVGTISLNCTLLRINLLRQKPSPTKSYASLRCGYRLKKWYFFKRTHNYPQLCSEAVDFDRLILVQLRQIVPTFTWSQLSIARIQIRLFVFTNHVIVNDRLFKMRMYPYIFLSPERNTKCIIHVHLIVGTISLNCTLLHIKMQRQKTQRQLSQLSRGDKEFCGLILVQQSLIHTSLRVRYFSPKRLGIFTL